MLSFSSNFSGANKDSPWWTALKALLLPGAPWAPPGDPLVSWDCERWWFAKSTVRSFLACLEASAAEEFKYSEGTSLKKNVLLGSNWNRSAKEKESSRFCFTKFYQRGVFRMELSYEKAVLKPNLKRGVGCRFLLYKCPHSSIHIDFPSYENKHFLPLQFVLIFNPVKNRNNQLPRRWL